MHSVKQREENRAIRVNFQGAWGWGLLSSQIEDQRALQNRLLRKKIIGIKGSFRHSGYATESHKIQVINES